MTKATQRYILLFGLLMALTVVIFRSVALNISTHLLDWNDYPYYVWTVIQQAENVRSFHFFSLGDANIYWPHQNVLFFSDLLLPHAVIAAILLSVTQEYILIFNLLFFLTISLNVVTAIMVWRRFTTDFLLLFFACLATVFSPFIFVQLGHFQMLNIWPFLLAMYFLLSQQQGFSWKRSLIIGLLIAVQFVTSVYLAVFLIWAVLLWFSTQFLALLKHKKNLKTLIQHFFTTFGTFIFFVFPFLFKYFAVQKAYDIQRSYGEYVLYAAHLTDYFFQPYRSLLATYVFSGWNKFNQHVVGELAGWPGFSLFLVSLFGIFQHKISSKSVQLSFPITQQRLFFLLLILSGLIFSFGPRLNVNGAYANIPLPYHVIMKLVPLFEPIRATSRWSFLLYFGLIFFCLEGFKKIQTLGKKKVLVLLAIFIFILEIIPVGVKAEARAYFSPRQYAVATSECTAQKDVLLEYPINRMLEKQDISEYLTYKTQIMLASLHHRCNIVNGYSGFTPKEIDAYETQLIQSFQKQDASKIEELLQQKNVALVKVNIPALEASDSARVVSTLSQLKNLTLMASDEATLMYGR